MEQDKQMLKCVAISDTHAMHENLTLPDGDVLIHAGDFCSRGTLEEAKQFAEWFEKQPFNYKIVIAGNHDLIMEDQQELANELFNSEDNVHYLFDSAIEIDRIKFWGSPFTPRFFNWAFMEERSKLAERWAKIPLDTDVVIVHGPPQNHLDRCYDGRRVGCAALAKRLSEVNPQFGVFGHIHESYGLEKVSGRIYINASSCTLQYKCINKPVVFEVEKR